MTPKDLPEARPTAPTADLAGHPGETAGGSRRTLGGLVAAGAAALTVAGVVVAASLGLGGVSPWAPSSDGREGTPPAAHVEASSELVGQRAADRAALAPEPRDAPPAVPRAATPPLPTLQPVAPEPRAVAAPATAAAPASTSVRVSSARVSEDGALVLAVAGDPGREVQAYADAPGAAGGTGGLSRGVPLAMRMAATRPLATTTLDRDGAGTIVLTLDGSQVRADAEVQVRYAGARSGDSGRLSEWGVLELLLALVAPPADPPADPATPAHPATPADPADPADPAAPADPATPAEPSVPATPSDPALADPPALPAPVPAPLPGETPTAAEPAAPPVLTPTPAPTDAEGCGAAWPGRGEDAPPPWDRDGDWCAWWAPGHADENLSAG
jgi:hypothetical protein